MAFGELFKRLHMLCGCTRLIKTLVGIFLAGHCFIGWALDSDIEMATRYKMQVDRFLVVPEPETRKYAKLASEALSNAGLLLSQSQYVVVVDRDPNVQALLLYWRSASGEFRLVGASPVSTGRPGSYEHFETPVGVFDHSTANLDFRAEGTRNGEGIRGYGEKGMRIYDLGWKRVPRGWGDGSVSEMRLQMHATDPDLLERRLGSVQSKGCIRIPATLNRLIDHYGLLDADYDQALREGRKLWMLDAQREPVPDPGRYVIVVDSERQDRPDWAPAPFLPHRKPTRPAVKK
jgi:hypothetical protein